MGSQPIPKTERSPVEVAKEELEQIRRLLERATADLDHVQLNQAHEALLAARHNYERLAKQVGTWSGEHLTDQQVFTLHLAQIEQAISRSEHPVSSPRHRINKSVSS